MKSQPAQVGEPANCTRNRPTKLVGLEMKSLESGRLPSSEGIVPVQLVIVIEFQSLKVGQPTQFCEVWCRLAGC